MIRQKIFPCEKSTVFQDKESGGSVHSGQVAHATPEWRLRRTRIFTLKQTDYQKYQKKVRFLMKLDLLILDDFLLHTVTDEREIKVLFEIMEKRSELCKSTIVCSQREPNSWASMILNDEVSANSILKRATKHYTVVIKPRE